MPEIGYQQSHYGSYYTVENARIYTLPDEAPPIVVAAGGSRAAELAGLIGDGLAATSPDKELKREFEKAGGKGKPCYAEAPVCWADDEAKARGAAHAYWPTAALTGELSQVLPVPAHFEQAAKMVKEEDVAKEIVCGPDPERYLAKINKFLREGKNGEETNNAR